MCRVINTLITEVERLLTFQLKRHVWLSPDMDAPERTSTPTVVVAAPIAVHLTVLPHSPGLSRRQSPCFVEATDDDFTERSRDALIEAQRVLIEKYCILTLHGVFRTSVSDQPPLLCVEPNSHPIQDPTGALFLALLVVRKNRPRGDCWMSRPWEDRLQIQYRLDLAALITVCNKLCNSHFALDLATFLQYLFKQFLYHGEMRSFAAKRRRLCDEFCEKEMDFLTSEPLHTLLADNPQTTAELIIGDLYDKGELSLSNAKVFRGSTFFLLGACAMNHKDDVLETLSRRYGDRAIGQACVLVLIVLLTVRGIPLAESNVEKHERFTLPDPDEKLDLIAVTILQNCLGKYANQLRVGPYRVEVLLSEPPHLVQLLLRPDVLKEGLVKLEERLLKELV
jgi:hypothetical protein